MAALFLWTLTLSVSPALHVRVHADATQSEHSCAVTFVTSGSYDHAAQLPQPGPLLAANQFSKIPALTPHWVESPFASACIFEHAPPAHS
jgi:hypothetical protein